MLIYGHLCDKWLKKLEPSQFKASNCMYIGYKQKTFHGSGLSFLHKCCNVYFVMLFSLHETVIKNIETLTKNGENVNFCRWFNYIPPSSVEFVFHFFFQLHLFFASYFKLREF